MEILSFGIDRAPEGKKSPDYAVRFPISLQPPTSLATIVNSAPRGALNGSRSGGNAFTLPWNPCSRSRGNPVHHPVEYAADEEILADGAIRASTSPWYGPDTRAQARGVNPECCEGLKARLIK
jgi:hypothetical protein